MFNLRSTAQRKSLLMGGIAGAMLILSIAVVFAQGPLPRPSVPSGRDGAAGSGLRSPRAALGTGITYQGQLKNGGAVVNGQCDMAFRLYDDPAAGTQIGSAITQTVAITSGVFTVVLNDAGQFGAGAFNGDARWLEMRVSTTCPAGANFTTLVPRQQLSAAPYALFSAAPWVTGVSNTLSYNAGNVGIGTAVPVSKLHILSAAGDSPPRLESSGTASFAAGWDFYQGNTAKGYVGVPDSATGLGPGELVLFGGTGTKTSLWAGGNRSVTINTNGNVGIGTPISDTKLYVEGTGILNPFIVTNFYGQPGLNVDFDGTVVIGALSGSTTTHACFANNVFLKFAACSSAAEYVPSIDGGAGFPETADLVSLAPTVKNPFDDEHSPFVVTKSNKPCDGNLLGFIVNPESGADGKKLNERYLPLAIYGYFPAKVTLENGAIKRGDPLTSSSKPGYGMKATRACTIIGYALEDADKEGTIQVFANHGESSAPEVTALRAQVATQAAQLASQQQQIDTLSARLTTLEHSVQSGSGPTPGGK